MHDNNYINSSQDMHNYLDQLSGIKPPYGNGKSEICDWQRYSYSKPFKPTKISKPPLPRISKWKTTDEGKQQNLSNKHISNFSKTIPERVKEKCTPIPIDPRCATAIAHRSSPVIPNSSSNYGGYRDKLKVKDYDKGTTQSYLDPRFPNRTESDNNRSSTFTGYSKLPNRNNWIQKCNPHSQSLKFEPGPDKYDRSLSMSKLLEKDTANVERQKVSWNITSFKIPTERETLRNSDVKKTCKEHSINTPNQKHELKYDQTDFSYKFPSYDLKSKSKEYPNMVLDVHNSNDKYTKGIQNFFCQNLNQHVDKTLINPSIKLDEVGEQKPKNLSFHNRVHMTNKPYRKHRGRSSSLMRKVKIKVSPTLSKIDYQNIWIRKPVVMLHPISLDLIEKYNLDIPEKFSLCKDMLKSIKIVPETKCDNLNEEPRNLDKKSAIKSVSLQLNVPSTNEASTKVIVDSSMKTNVTDMKTLEPQKHDRENFLSSIAKQLDDTMRLTSPTHCSELLLVDPKVMSMSKTLQKACSTQSVASALAFKNVRLKGPQQPKYRSVNKKSQIFNLEKLRCSLKGTPTKTSTSNKASTKISISDYHNRRLDDHLCSDSKLAKDDFSSHQSSERVCMKEASLQNEKTERPCKLEPCSHLSQHTPESRENRQAFKEDNSRHSERISSSSLLFVVKRTSVDELSIQEPTKLENKHELKQNPQVSKDLDCKMKQDGCKSGDDDVEDLICGKTSTSDRDKTLLTKAKELKFGITGGGFCQESDKVETDAEIISRTLSFGKATSKSCQETPGNKVKSVDDLIISCQKTNSMDVGEIFRKRRCTSDGVCVKNTGHRGVIIKDIRLCDLRHQGGLDKKKTVKVSKWQLLVDPNANLGNGQQKNDILENSNIGTKMNDCENQGQAVVSKLLQDHNEIHQVVKESSNEDILMDKTKHTENISVGSSEPSIVPELPVSTKQLITSESESESESEMQHMVTCAVERGSKEQKCAIIDPPIISLSVDSNTSICNESNNSNINTLCESDIQQLSHVCHSDGVCETKNDIIPKLFDASVKHPLSDVILETQVIECGVISVFNEVEIETSMVETPINLQHVKITDPLESRTLKLERESVNMCSVIPVSKMSLSEQILVNTSLPFNSIRTICALSNNSLCIPAVTCENSIISKISSDFINNFNVSDSESDTEMPLKQTSTSKSDSFKAITGLSNSVVTTCTDSVVAKMSSDFINDLNVSDSESDTDMSLIQTSTSEDTSSAHHHSILIRSTTKKNPEQLQSKAQLLQGVSLPKTCVVSLKKIDSYTKMQNTSMSIKGDMELKVAASLENSRDIGEDVYDVNNIMLTETSEDLLEFIMVPSKCETQNTSSGLSNLTYEKDKRIHLTDTENIEILETEEETVEYPRQSKKRSHDSNPTINDIKETQSSDTDISKAFDNDKNMVDYGQSSSKLVLASNDTNISNIEKPVVLSSLNQESQLVGTDASMTKEDSEVCKIGSDYIHGSPATSFRSETNTIGVSNASKATCLKDNDSLITAGISTDVNPKETIQASIKMNIPSNISVMAEVALTSTGDHPSQTEKNKDVEKDITDYETSAANRDSTLNTERDQTSDCTDSDIQNPVSNESIVLVMDENNEIQVSRELEEVLSRSMQNTPPVSNYKPEANKLNSIPCNEFVMNTPSDLLDSPKPQTEQRSPMLQSDKDILRENYGNLPENCMMSNLDTLVPKSDLNVKTTAQNQRSRSPKLENQSDTKPVCSIPKLKGLKLSNPNYYEGTPLYLSDINTSTQEDYSTGMKLPVKVVMLDNNEQNMTDNTQIMMKSTELVESVKMTSTSPAEASVSTADDYHAERQESNNMLPNPTWIKNEVPVSRTCGLPVQSTNTVNFSPNTGNIVPSIESMPDNLNVVKSPISINAESMKNSMNIVPAKIPNHINGVTTENTQSINIDRNSINVVSTMNSDTINVGSVNCPNDISIVPRNVSMSNSNNINIVPTIIPNSFNGVPVNTQQIINDTSNNLRLVPLINANPINIVPIYSTNNIIVLSGNCSNTVNTMNMSNQSSFNVVSIQNANISNSVSSNRSDNMKINSVFPIQNPIQPNLVAINRCSVLINNQNAWTVASAQNASKMGIVQNSNEISSVAVNTTVSSDIPMNTSIVPNNYFNPCIMNTMTIKATGHENNSVLINNQNNMTLVPPNNPNNMDIIPMNIPYVHMSNPAPMSNAGGINLIQMNSSVSQSNIHKNLEQSNSSVSVSDIGISTTNTSNRKRHSSGEASTRCPDTTMFPGSGVHVRDFEAVQQISVQNSPLPNLQIHTASVVASRSRPIVSATTSKHLQIAHQPVAVESTTVFSEQDDLLHNSGNSSCSVDIEANVTATATVINSPHKLIFRSPAFFSSEDILSLEPNMYKTGSNVLHKFDKYSITATTPSRTNSVTTERIASTTFSTECTIENETVTDDVKQVDSTEENVMNTTIKYIQFPNNRITTETLLETSSDHIQLDDSQPLDLQITDPLEQSNDQLKQQPDESLEQGDSPISETYISKSTETEDDPKYIEVSVLPPDVGEENSSLSMVDDKYLEYTHDGNQDKNISETELNIDSLDIADNVEVNACGEENYCPDKSKQVHINVSIPFQQIYNSNKISIASTQIGISQTFLSSCNLSSPKLSLQTVNTNEYEVSDPAVCGSVDAIADIPSDETLIYSCDELEDVKIAKSKKSLKKKRRKLSKMVKKFREGFGSNKAIFQTGISTKIIIRKRRRCEVLNSIEDRIKISETEESDSEYSLIPMSEPPVKPSTRDHKSEWTIRDAQIKHKHVHKSKGRRKSKKDKEDMASESDLDELPVIHVPKRRRLQKLSSSGHTMQGTIFRTSLDSDRIRLELPLHNWLENKLNNRPESKSSSEEGLDDTNKPKHRTELNSLCDEEQDSSNSNKVTKQIKLNSFSEDSQDGANMKELNNMTDAKLSSNESVDDTNSNSSEKETKFNKNVSKDNLSEIKDSQNDDLIHDEYHEEDGFNRLIVDENPETNGDVYSTPSLPPLADRDKINSSVGQVMTEDEIKEEQKPKMEKLHNTQVNQQAELLSTTKEAKDVKVVQEEISTDDTMISDTTDYCQPLNLCTKKPTGVLIKSSSQKPQPKVQLVHPQIVTLPVQVEVESANILETTKSAITSIIITGSEQAPADAQITTNENLSQSAEGNFNLESEDLPTPQLNAFDLSKNTNQRNIERATHQISQHGQSNTTTQQTEMGVLTSAPCDKKHSPISQNPPEASISRQHLKIDKEFEQHIRDLKHLELLAKKKEQEHAHVLALSRKKVETIMKMKLQKKRSEALRISNVDFGITNTSPDKNKEPNVLFTVQTGSASAICPYNTVAHTMQPTSNNHSSEPDQAQNNTEDSTSVFKSNSISSSSLKQNNETRRIALSKPKASIKEMAGKINLAMQEAAHSKIIKHPRLEKDLQNPLPAHQSVKNTILNLEPCNLPNDASTLCPFRPRTSALLEPTLGQPKKSYTEPIQLAHCQPAFQPAGSLIVPAFSNSPNLNKATSPPVYNYHGINHHIGDANSRTSPGLVLSNNANMRSTSQSDMQLGISQSPTNSTQATYLEVQDRKRKFDFQMAVVDLTKEQYQRPVSQSGPPPFKKAKINDQIVTVVQKEHNVALPSQQVLANPFDDSNQSKQRDELQNQIKHKSLPRTRRTRYSSSIPQNQIPFVNSMFERNSQYPAMSASTTNYPVRPVPSTTMTPPLLQKFLQMPPELPISRPMYPVRHPAGPNYVRQSLPYRDLEPGEIITNHFRPKWNQTGHQTSSSQVMMQDCRQFQMPLQQGQSPQVIPQHTLSRLPQEQQQQKFNEALNYLPSHHPSSLQSPAGGLPQHSIHEQRDINSFQTSTMTSFHPTGTHQGIRQTTSMIPPGAQHGNQSQAMASMPSIAHNIPRLNQPQMVMHQTVPGSCHVCGKASSFVCSGCRKAWYCSQPCQNTHWGIHSRNCKKS